MIDINEKVKKIAHERKNKEIDKNKQNKSPGKYYKIFNKIAEKSRSPS